jgi:PAS domain S-box-containing protein
MKRESSYEEIEKDIADLNGALKTIKKDARVEEAINNIIENVRFQAAELRRREEELKKSQDYTTNLVRSTPNPTSVMTSEGKRVDTNLATERLFRRSRKEIVGAKVEELYAKEDLEKIRNTLEESKKTGFGSCEATCIRGDKTEFPAVLNFAPVKDEKGKIINVLGTATDITELRKREEELTNASCDVTEIMEAISAGDYQKKVSEDYSLPEVVNLTKSMNVVMGSLEKSEEELKAFIKELATPAIEAVEGVVVMPLVGKLTSDRALDAMEVMLNKLEEVRGKAGIIDITGVSGIDSAVADNLTRTMESIKLFGAEPLLTGVSGKTAQNLARLGIKFEFMTKSTLAEGLRYALQLIRQEEKERGL